MKISRAKVKKAIVGSGGIIARICKTTGYSWAAVRDMIKADAELTEMVVNEEETVDDAAENTLITKILGGDDAVARWWLARRRSKRYGNKLDVTSDGKTIAPETMKPSEIAERVAAILAITQKKNDNG